MSDNSAEVPAGRSDWFAAAWELIDAAAAHAEEIHTVWNRLRDTDLFSSSVAVDADGSGRIDVYVDWPSESFDELQAAARSLVQSVISCLQKAVDRTERCVSGAIRSATDCSPTFPLCRNPSEFVEVVQSGRLSGLRPDQIQLVEKFQPFDITSDNRTITHIRRVMRRLANLSDAISEQDAELVV